MSLIICHFTANILEIHTKQGKAYKFHSLGTSASLPLYATFADIACPTSIWCSLLMYDIAYFYIVGQQHIYLYILSHISGLKMSPLLCLMYSQININTDAGLHVVIKLVGKHIYTTTLCVRVFMYARLRSPVLFRSSFHPTTTSLTQ